MKHVRVLNKNILFDLASLFLSVIMLGPLVNVLNEPLFKNQDELIEAVIKTQISGLFPEYAIEVEDIEVTSVFSLTPIEIKIHNMNIIGPKVRFVLPESKLKFGIESILLGGMPQTLNLDGVKILLDAVTREKEIHNSIFNTDKPNELISNLISGVFEGASLAGLPRRIRIILDEFRMVEQQDLEGGNIIIDDASFDAFLSRPENFRALLSLKTSTIGKANFSIEANLKNLSWNATTNVQSIDIRSLKAFLPKYFQEKELQGVVSGELNTEFQAINLISADGNFDFKNIRVYSELEENLHISQFSGWFDYDAYEKSAAFTNLVLKPSPELKVKGAIQLDNIGKSDLQISATAETRDTPLKILPTYFFSEPFASFYQVLTRHSSGGVLDFASIKLQAAKEAGIDKIDWQRIQLDGQISGQQITASNRQYKKVSAKAKSIFSANLDKNNLINKLLLSSTFSDGQIKLADTDRVVENISGKLDFSFDKHTIQNASIKFSQPEAGEAIFTAEIPQLKQTISMLGDKTYREFKKSLIKGKDPTLGVLTLETERFDADLLLELWPEKIGSNTRNWLSMRGKGGEFRNAKLRAFATLSDGNPLISFFKLPFDKTRIAGISGTWAWHNFDFTWKEESPSVQSIDLEARIFDNHLSMEILEATMPDLKMKNGQIDLYPVMGYENSSLKRALEVEVTIDGSIPAFNKLLDDPTIDKLPVEIKKLTRPRGNIIAKISTVSELQYKKLKLNSISAVASLSATSFGNLPLNETLSAGNIELTLEENGKIFFNGTGKISGVASSFSGQQTADKVLSVVVKTAASEYLSRKINEFTKLNVSGNSALRLHLNYVSDAKSGKGSIKADLTDAAIDLPIFNWTKIPGEIGKVDASFDFSHKSITKLEVKDAIIGTLQGKGLFEFSPDLSAYKATVTNFSFPGYDIDKLIITTDKDKSIKVFAEGGLIDTTFLRRTEGVTKNREISFDFTSARLQLAQDITLQGRLIGDIDKLGSGTAILNGTLLLEQSPLIEEATIEAIFDEQFETLSGNGLIGGVEATLLYESLADDSSYLMIKSQNAGRTLIGLGVLDTIRGGELILKNVYQNGKFDNFKTEIKVTDFSVIEAPKSVRALSVLSVTGLYSLIEGDGTKFDVGIANIETFGNRRILKNVQASGEALKFELAGEYDRETDELQVRGILAPLSLISDIIGVIPFVSNIITGQDKTGLLATQFEMSGKLSDPITTINPASVIAPGVMRNILSPGWLTRESGIRIDPQQKK